MPNLFSFSFFLSFFLSFFIYFIFFCEPFQPIPWNFIGPLPVSHSANEKDVQVNVYGTGHVLFSKKVHAPKRFTEDLCSILQGL